MKNLYRFNIADLAIAINADRHYTTANAYKDFYDSAPVVSDNIHFSLDIFSSKKSPFSKNDSECLFDSGGIWKLYRDKNNLCRFVTDNRELIIDKSTSCGELYSSTKRIIRNNIPFSYPLDELLIINLLPSCNGILVHACGINDKGRGILFLGVSGAGKSTIAKLWLDEPGVTVLSDDRIIIRKIDGKFYAYGTPWHGDANVSNPGKIEIEKIYFLAHSDKNYCKRMNLIDASSSMIVRCFPTFWDKDGMASTLRLIDKIVKKIPCHELGFVPDKDAIKFIRSVT